MLLHSITNSVKIKLQLNNWSTSFFAINIEEKLIEVYTQSNDHRRKKNDFKLKLTQFIIRISDHDLYIMFLQILKVNNQN